MRCVKSPGEYSFRHYDHAMTNKQVVGTGLVLALTVALSGCATPSPEPTGAGEEVDRAASITSIDEGIAWARSLDDDTTADELSVGIGRIGDLVIGLNMSSEESSEISSALLTLSTEVDSDPEDVDDHVEDLKEIVDDIEAGIERAS
jgi:hypothetical protein